MKEIDNVQDLAKATNLYGDDAFTLTNLSDMIENDMLRYERTLSAEEDIDEY